MDGVENPAAQTDAAQEAEDNVERRWQLKRNCCVYPGQFLLGLGVMTVPVALIGLHFLFSGLWVVSLFCVAEIVGIVLAGLVYARHARDGETIALLHDGRMLVDVHDGLRCTRHVFNRNWSRLVHVQGRPGSLWLHHGGVRLRLARHVSPKRRDRFEAQLRRSLPWRGIMHAQSGEMPSSRALGAMGTQVRGAALASRARHEDG